MRAEASIWWEIDFLTVFGLRQIASAMQGFFIEKYLILSIGILYIKSVFYVRLLL